MRACTRCLGGQVIYDRRNRPTCLQCGFDPRPVPEPLQRLNGGRDPQLPSDKWQKSRTQGAETRNRTRS